MKIGGEAGEGWERGVGDERSETISQRSVRDGTLAVLGDIGDSFFT